jgi:hypothetical protein
MTDVQTGDPRHGGAPVRLQAAHSSASTIGLS